MIVRCYDITINDEIIAELGGLPADGPNGKGAIESALQRVENHIGYKSVDDIFAIAALYAVAIARGHVFNDGNKRTGLTCALTYLYQQGILIPEVRQLENIMVDVASGKLKYETLAALLSIFWEEHGSRIVTK